MGSDHRSIYLRCNIIQSTKESTNKKKRSRVAPKSKSTWPPDNLTVYNDNLTATLTTTSFSNDLDEKCRQIEDALKQA
eukprot:4928973-Karenia_brevis.AAC.1